MSTRPRKYTSPKIVGPDIVALPAELPPGAFSKLGVSGQVQDPAWINSILRQTLGWGILGAKYLTHGLSTCRD